jgi:hypothetical protein
MFCRNVEVSGIKRQVTTAKELGLGGIAIPNFLKLIKILSL